jgi:hypothetical protein
VAANLSRPPGGYGCAARKLTVECISDPSNSPRLSLHFVHEHGRHWMQTLDVEY